MKSRGLLLGLALLLACGYPAGKAFGQAVYGSIIGTVTDSSGAAVPGATVTITDIDKDIISVSTTNEAGAYSHTHLIVGNYRVRVEAPGFQAYVQENVRLNVDAAARVDAVLQVGAVTQTVEVTAEIPLLKTERTDVATSFQTKAVAELPIYDRNFTKIELLTPGTQMLGWQHASSENPQGSVQISVNGQHFSGTSFQLDGTDNRDPILGIIVINPTLESVTEAKITSQNYDAEFGQATAGVVSAQTKSGSNELHGSAFLFRRNDLTMARQPFSQSQPLDPDEDPNKFIPDTLWNQFGGSLGGPIKKNKTFIFGDYQGTRRKNGGSVLTSVPTALARTGDLSEYPADIFDPQDALGNELDPANRSQFSSGGVANAIPASRLSPESLAILDLIPMPNIPGAGVENNFTGSGTERFDDDAFNVRVDHYYSDNLHLFGRYSFARFKRAGPGAFGDLLGGPAFDNIFFAGTSDVRNQSIASGFDYTVTPSLLTDFRFGFYRYRVFVRPGGGGTPASDLGIDNLNFADDPFTLGMPAFFINGTGGFNLGYSLGTNQCNCPLDQEEQQWQFVNNWTKIQGNHTFKFGTDIRYAQNLRVPSDNHRSGELSFDNDRTRGPSGGGLGLAGFLLGDVSSFRRYVSNINDAGERQHRQFFYGQDTWRITPKFTLSFGLRWEVYYPQTVTSAGAGGFLQPATGEVWVAGENGVGLNGNVENTFTNFAPRVGIAYQISPKTVVRMGYGRSFDIGVFGSTFGHSVTQNLPVLAIESRQPANSFNSVFNLANVPARVDPNSALDDQVTAGNVGPNGFPLLPNGIESFVLPFEMRLPTVDAWNATFQHQVTPSIALEVAYVGNKGTHVFVGEGPDYNFNDATLEGFPLLSSNERKPFFQLYGWSQGFRYFGNDSNNRYHSLQTKVEKRFSGSYSLLAHYTLQRAWNYDGGFNSDRSVNWGRNDFFATSVFVVNNMIELPFGRGKTYMSNAGRAVDYLVGGWQINQVTTYWSGNPFNVSYRDCGADRDVGPCRPDLVGDVLLPHQQDAWFQVVPGSVGLDANGVQVGPWRRPEVGQFGNVGRNPLTGPSFLNTDFSLFKNFAITERVRGQFRAEAFNLFNMVNLSNPDSCVDCNPDNAGRIFGLRQGAQMRRFQFALKFDF